MQHRQLLWRAVFIAYMNILLVTAGTHYILIQGIPWVHLSGFRNLLRVQVYESQALILRHGLRLLPPAREGNVFEEGLPQKEAKSRILIAVTENDMEDLEIIPVKNAVSGMREGDFGSRSLFIGILNKEEKQYRIAYSLREEYGDYVIAGIDETELVKMFRPWVFVYFIINSGFLVVMFFLSIAFVRWMFRPIREYELRLEVNAGKLSKANEKLRKEMRANKEEDRYQQQLVELYRLLAIGSASSYFAQFLSYLRELFYADAAILTFLRGEYIQNIFFSADAQLRIKFPIGFDSSPVSRDKLEIIAAAKKKRVAYIDAPRESLFGKCRLERSVIFSAAGEGGATALLQIGLKTEGLTFVQKQHLERLFDSIEPSLIAIAQEEWLKKQRRDAIIAKRESEEQYRKMFDASQDMLVDVDREGRIKKINRAGKLLLKIQAASDVIDHRFSEFFVQEDACEYIFSILEAKGYIKDHEIILTDGSSHKFCLLSATADYDGRGTVSGFSGTIKDISERIKLDQQLWAMNMELSETNSKLKQSQMQAIQNEKLASIGQLSAGVAHEINNPLGFVKSNFHTMGKYSESLLACIDELAGAVDTETHHTILKEHDYEYIKNDIISLLTETSEGIGRILSIVSNLKNFARSEDSNEKRDLLDINEAIDNTLVIARNEYKYHAKVENRTAEKVTVYCNGGEIKQVLLNIIVNSSQAIKEIMDDGGLIRINAYKKKDEVCIEIEDNGPGVPEEIRMSIFDPFFTTKEEGKGTGLGLSISHDIVVNKHGGRMYIGDSELGGAKFTVLLPLEQEGEAQELLDEAE